MIHVLYLTNYAQNYTQLQPLNCVVKYVKYSSNVLCPGAELCHGPPKILIFFYYQPLGYESDSNRKGKSIWPSQKNMTTPPPPPILSRIFTQSNRKQPKVPNKILASSPNCLNDLLSIQQTITHTFKIPSFTTYFKQKKLLFPILLNLKKPPMGFSKKEEATTATC